MRSRQTQGYLTLGKPTSMRVRLWACFVLALLVFALARGAAAVAPPTVLPFGIIIGRHRIVRGDYWGFVDRRGVAHWHYTRRKTTEYATAPASTPVSVSGWLNRAIPSLTERLNGNVTEAERRWLDLYGETTSVVWMWDGGDATYAKEFLDGNNLAGTCTTAVATDQTHTGPYAFKVSFGATGSTAAGYGYKAGLLALTGRRVSFWFRFSNTPTINAHIWLYTKDDFANIVYSVQLRTDGKLYSNISGAGVSNTGGTVLSASTWYRVSVGWSQSGSSNTFNVYLNGTLEATQTAVPTNTTGTTLCFGTAGAQGVNSAAFWYDDIYVDDQADATDTTDIRVTYKAPGSVVDNQWDTTIGSGAVNERPISETNGKEDILGASGDAQDYALQTASAGDVDITNKILVGYMGWWWAKRDVSAASAVFVVNTSTYTKSVATTSALYTQVVTSTSYPSGNVGMQQSGTVKLIYLYECGVLIAYYQGNTLTGTGIASAAALGTPTEQDRLTGAGAVASTQALGTPTEELRLTGAGAVATAAALGTPSEQGRLTSAGAIASAEAEGTPTEELRLTGAGAVATAAALGTPSEQYRINDSSITSTEAVGTPTEQLGVSNAGAVASSQAFGTPTEELRLTGVGAVASAEAVGTPGGQEQIDVTGKATDEAFGTATCQFRYYPTAVATMEAFGTPAFQGRLSPSGIVTLQAFGLPTFREGIYPTGIASAQAVGTPTMLVDYIAGITSIGTTEAFGTPRIALHLQADSIDSEEAFGTLRLRFRYSLAGGIGGGIVGNPNLGGAIGGMATGIGSAEGFGTPYLQFLIYPVGIASEEALGWPALFPPNRLNVHSLPVTEAVGTPDLDFVLHGAGGIDSLEAVPTPKVQLALQALGIASLEALGLPVLQGAISVTGIETGEAFGTPYVSFVIQPSSLPDTEALGTPYLRYRIYVLGIRSREAFGDLRVTDTHATAGRGGALSVGNLGHRTGVRRVEE